MKRVDIFAAQGLEFEEDRDDSVHIYIRTPMPDQRSREAAYAFHASEAAALCDAIWTYCPGGTVDALIVALMQRRSDVLRVVAGFLSILLLLSAFWVGVVLEFFQPTRLAGIGVLAGDALYLAAWLVLDIRRGNRLRAQSVPRPPAINSKRQAWVPLDRSLSGLAYDATRPPWLTNPTSPFRTRQPALTDTQRDLAAEDAQWKRYQDGQGDQ